MIVNQTIWTKTSRSEFIISGFLHPCSHFVLLGNRWTSTLPQHRKSRTEGTQNRLRTRLPRSLSVGGECRAFLNGSLSREGVKGSPSACWSGRRRCSPSAGGSASSWRSSCWRCSCCSDSPAASSPPWPHACPRCRREPRGRQTSCRRNWTSSQR